jgi:ketosteroid isomerase-like protein
MAGGRMVELREYLDTALVEAVFGGDRGARTEGE